MKVIDISIQDGKGVLCATDYKKNLIVDSTMEHFRTKAMETEKSIIKDKENRLTDWSERAVQEDSGHTYYRYPRVLFNNNYKIYLSTHNKTQIILGEGMDKITLEEYSSHAREHENMETTLTEFVSFFEELLGVSLEIDVDYIIKEFETQYLQTLFVHLTAPHAPLVRATSYVFESVEKEKAFDYFIKNPSKFVTEDFDERLLLNAEDVKIDNIEEIKKCPLIYRGYLKRNNFKKLVQSKMPHKGGIEKTLHFFLDFISTEQLSMRWSGSDPSWVQDDKVWAQYMEEARIAHSYIMQNNVWYAPDIRELGTRYSLDKLKEYKIFDKKEYLEDFVSMKQTIKQFSVLQDYQIIVV